MFKNVLIAEDHESASISLRKTLDEVGVTRTDYVYYCDLALTRIQIGLRDGRPFDLLITDLSFDEDQNQQELKGGEALIAAAKQMQPDLKILVFSAEGKAAVIDTLFNQLGIDGYVRKSRQDAQELKQAMESLWKNRTHFPAQLRRAVKQKNAHDFTDFDITIISLLSQGMLQKDIPAYLQENGIRPSGLSSLEKRLSLIKEVLEFTKNEQLVAYCKDFGII
jgi:two-component system capsular synthesis response regulator RcsB